MVHLAVSSNLTGERGRGVKGGDRESHTGITVEVLTTLNNQKLGGDSIKGIRKRTSFIHRSCIGHHLILMTYIITMMGLVKERKEAMSPLNGPSVDGMPLVHYKQLLLQEHRGS